MFKSHKGFTSVETVLVLSIVVIVAAVSIQLLRNQRANSNSQYFSALTEKTKAFYHEQATAMDVQTNDQKLFKWCYRTNQTVVDHGDLWCGIRVTQKISITPTESYLEDFQARLKATLKKENFYILDGGVTTGAIKGISFSAGKSQGADPKLCSMSLEYSPHTAYPDAMTTVTYTLSCDHPSSGLVAGFDDHSNI